MDRRARSGWLFGLVVCLIGGCGSKSASPDAGSGTAGTTGTAGTGTAGDSGGSGGSAGGVAGSAGPAGTGGGAGAAATPMPCAAQTLAIGGAHVCALTTAGGVRCWGAGTKGQLGNGLWTDRSTPPLVDVMRDVKAIAAGQQHTCAVTNAGGVRCWGLNTNGQLGDGTTTDRAGPTSFDVLTGVRAIAAGWSHTCAIMTSGGARCWGKNQNGQLGVGTSGLNTDLNAPPATDAIADVQAIAAGGSHTCALTTAGGVRCWGSPLGGALGLPPPIGDTNRPSTTDTLTGVSAIDAGRGHTCALTTAGGVRCWGDNVSGEVGDGSNTASVMTPTADVLTDVRGISTSGVNTCALSNAGGVRCWGVYGLGDETNVISARRTPPATDFLTGAREIIGGMGSTTCVFTTAGGVRCWGSNGNGQLGDGTTARPDEYRPPTAELPELMGSCP